MTDQTLAFTNTPYSIVPAGRLKNIELLLTSSDNVPVPSAKLSLTLPANFAYADGGSGQRDFITDDAGKVSVSGVKGVPAPGAYSLSATSGSETASTTVTVMGLGPVGSIPVRVNPQRIAVSPDGTGTNASVGGGVGETKKPLSRSGDCGFFMPEDTARLSGRFRVAPAGNLFRMWERACSRRSRHSHPNNSAEPHHPGTSRLSSPLFHVS